MTFSFRFGFGLLVLFGLRDARGEATSPEFALGWHAAGMVHIPGEQVLLIDTRDGGRTGVLRQILLGGGNKFKILTLIPLSPTPLAIPDRLGLSLGAPRSGVVAVVTREFHTPTGWLKLEEGYALDVIGRDTWAFVHRKVVEFGAVYRHSSVGSRREVELDLNLAEGQAIGEASLKDASRFIGSVGLPPSDRGRVIFHDWNQAHTRLVVRSSSGVEYAFATALTLNRASNAWGPTLRAYAIEVERASDRPLSDGELSAYRADPLDLAPAVGRVRMGCGRFFR